MFISGRVTTQTSTSHGCLNERHTSVRRAHRVSRSIMSKALGCPDPASAGDHQAPRREFLSASAAAAVLLLSPGNALAGQLNPLSKDYKMELARRRRKIPIEEFSDGPEGLKYYDIVVGDGDEPVVGDRVAVHYDVKFRSITIVTSRAGAGVTGGTPVGFNVGTPAGEPGGILPGIDLGVRGMHVGGLRRLLVPPELAYGDTQVGEIEPNSTLQIELELLSIKPKDPFGTRVKLVEG